MTTTQMSEKQNPKPSVTNKASLRRLLRLQRRSLSEEHRKKAAQSVEEKLRPLIQDSKIVVSYNSINEELDTNSLNLRLAEENRLAMPRIEGEKLTLYRVTDMSKQLVTGPWGLAEPDPSFCEEIPIQQVDAILVPAIAFDSRGHRLGYGKGYYDRLLKKLQKKCLTIGIAYKEQLISHDLPNELHDQTMKEIITG